MVNFTYKAKQGPQKIVSGRIEADNLDSAVAKILGKGLSPFDVKAIIKSQDNPSARPLSLGGSFARKISLAEITLFTRQVSDLLHAGIPLLQALLIIHRQTRHDRFRHDIQEMMDIVKDGGSFSSALGQFKDIFPALYVNMVRSGEIAGNLEVVTERLAEFMEKDQDIRSQIKSSLLYPMLILITGAITIFVLFTWVIPKITVIFDDLNQTLPLPTLVLISLSNFFAKFWWGILALIAVVLFYVKRIQASAPGKLWFDHLRLRIPVVGNFLKDAQLGRFARTLGTLLESGVDIITALNAVALVLDNEVLKSEALEISEQVKNGASLTEAVKAKRNFPEIVASMIAVGEQSGQIYKGLYKLADYYERQTRLFMKQMTALMEPVLILGLGLVVGFVVISMMMPIFQMNLIIK